MSVAQLRLHDHLKGERQLAEAQASVATGKLTFGDALARHKQRLHANPALKPRTKSYREERVTALLKSWPDLERMDVRKTGKTSCLDWAERFGQDASPIAFNNTVGTLRMILDLAIEAGARYDNPARFIKKVRVRPKQLHLPSQSQFLRLAEAIRGGDGGWGERCANLVCFLAYGGFRKSEAANIIWADCDFTKGEITVRGDAVTGTKNWDSRRIPMIPDMKRLLERNAQRHAVSLIERVGETQRRRLCELQHAGADQSQDESRLGVEGDL